MALNYIIYQTSTVPDDSKNVAFRETVHDFIALSITKIRLNSNLATKKLKWEYIFVTFKKR